MGLIFSFLYNKQLEPVICKGKKILSLKFILMLTVPEISREEWKKMIRNKIPQDFHWLHSIPQHTQTGSSPQRHVMLL